MKVACLANINNMMFILCRYLRDAGIDAQLFTLSDEPAHFSPEADSYDNDYLNFHTVLPITKSTLFKPESITLLKKELNGFNFLIGTDIAPAIAALVGKKLSVFIPHGSDIYALPFPTGKPKDANKRWWLNEKQTLGQIQRLGISNIETILFPDEYDIHFPFKNRLETVANYYNTSGPMVYIPQYKDLISNPITAKLTHAEVFNKLRENNDLLVFSHSRHNGFDLPPDLAVHQKGNQILIEGFAHFLKKQLDLKAQLILFDYGMNVGASKALINELEITDSVTWMPLMARKEIMYGLNVSDISCGQFENSWLTCGVVNETLASDIPLLHYRDDKLYTADYAELYPILNANSVSEITDALSNYLADSEKYKKQALEGSKWLHKYTVKKPLNIVLDRLENTDKANTLAEKTEKIKEKILKKHSRKAFIYRLEGKIQTTLGRNKN